MKTRLEINSDILIWAVERAGLDLGDFPEKFLHLSYWLSSKKKATIKNFFSKSSSTVWLSFSRSSYCRLI